MTDSYTANGTACCAECGRSLVPDEIALTKKLVNRGTTTYYCLSCLARHFEVTEAVLVEKIQEFREMGCTLFIQR